MKTGTLLLLAGGALVVGYVYNKEQAGRLLQVKLSSAKFNDATSGIITFKLINPSNTSLSFDSLTGTIIANGNQVSQVVSTTPLTVPANSSSDYPVNFYLSLGGIVSDIFSLIQGSAIGLNIAFNGTATVEGFPVPVNQSVSL